MKLKHAIPAALVLLSSSFLAGRLTAPKPSPVVKEASKEASKSEWHSETKKEAQTATNAASKTRLVKKTKTTKRPDGTTVSETTEVQTGQSLVSQASSASGSVSHTGGEEHTREYTKTSPLPNPPWGFTLVLSQDAQLALQSTFQPVAMVQVSRTLVGALNLSVFVTSPVRDFRLNQIRAGVSLVYHYQF
jgi:hypothetical protein